MKRERTSSNQGGMGRRSCNQRSLSVVARLGAISLVLACLGCAKPISFKPDTSSLGQSPPYAYSDRDWALVLRDYVHNGLVDYASLARNRQPLDRYYALLAVTGPSQTPDQFPSSAYATGYWINAYNALTINFVLAHFPAETIYDVSIPKIEEATFQVDGKTYTLPLIEAKILEASAGDVRALFATSRAAMGTPRLPNEPIHPASLESQLAEAAAEGLNNPKLLRIDHATRHILVWQTVLTRQNDFLNYLRTRRRVQSPSLFSVLLDLASSERRRALQSAIGYVFHDVPFDRALNNWSANRPSTDRPLIP